MPPRRAAPPLPPQEADPRRVVQGAIQARTFAAAYYLHGDDDYLKDAAIRDLLDAAIDPSTRDFNCEVRRGDGLEAELLASLLDTPPMLAERRALVVRDVGALDKGALAVMQRYLERPASDLLLLLVSPGGEKPLEALLRGAVPLDFAPLPPERVRRWIAYHGGTVLGVTVTDDAAALLQQAVGSDLQQLAGELDKCASYVQGAGGTAVDATVVAAVVGVRPGETLADLLDAVAARDGARAVALVGPVLETPKLDAVPVVMALATQAMGLAYARARRDGGLPTHALPKALFDYLKQTGGGMTGRPWGEAVSAWTRAAERWSAASCATALARLLEADQALKETRVSSDVQVVETLVLALCAPEGRAPEGRAPTGRVSASGRRGAAGVG
ncbi:MAG: DNA polymerase III subunit delta [Gemmatimonadetes bacterium]|nr:DNA polymerase III subunit delta [Gemmatimonadota bacterium]